MLEIADLHAGYAGVEVLHGVDLVDLFVQEQMIDPQIKQMLTADRARVQHVARVQGHHGRAAGRIDR